jgi:hypothetical protein
VNTVPQLRVELLLDPTPDLGDWMVLDHPVRGVLDGDDVWSDDWSDSFGVYTLAPDEFWYDVTGDVRAGGSIVAARGRSSQLEDVTPARASFVLNNRDRKYDPTNYAVDGLYPSATLHPSETLFPFVDASGSPLAGQLRPMRQVRMTAVWDGTAAPVFAGWIDDWGIEYPQYGESVITPQCFGPLGTLDAAYLPETRTPEDEGDLPGVRIGKVLDQAGYGPARDLDTGVSVLGATSYGVNAFTHLRNVARSDDGWLFEAADGTLVYRDRHRNLNVQPKVTFAEDGMWGVGALGPHLGTDMLWNRVSASGLSGIEVVVEDPESVAQFRPRTLQLSDLELRHDGDVTALASHLLGRFSQPRLRIRHFTVDLLNLTDLEQQQVLGLEVADRVRLVWTPPGGGGVASFDLTVEGVEQVPSRESWHVTFRTSWADTRPFLVLDDPQLGSLDGPALLAF